MPVLKSVITTTIVAAGLTVGAFAAPAQSLAQSSPADVESVTEGLIAAGMAIELGDVCGDVSVRMLRGLSFLNGLKNELEDAGFSDAEIDAYIDDDAEKDRLEAIARERLVALGAVPGDAASHCAVARDQIARSTQVGRLLR